MTLRLQTLCGIAVLLACVGCSASIPTLPDVVTGNWGSYRFSVQATATAVDFNLTCAGVHASEPLRPGADGRFELTGVLRNSQGPETPVTVRGSMDGDTISVKVISMQGSTPDTARYDAVRDIPRGTLGAYCPQ